MPREDYLERIGWEERWKSGDFSTVKRASSIAVFTVGLLLALSDIFGPSLLLKFLTCIMPTGMTLLMDSNQLRKVCKTLKDDKKKIAKKGQKGTAEMNEFLGGICLKDFHYSIHVPVPDVNSSAAAGATSSDVAVSPDVPTCSACAPEIISMRQEVSSLKSELSSLKSLLEEEKARTGLLSELVDKRDEEISMEKSKSRELIDQVSKLEKEISAVKKRLAGFNSGAARRKLAKKTVTAVTKKCTTQSDAKTKVTLAPVTKNIFKGSIGGVGAKSSLYARLPLRRKLNSEVSSQEISRRACEAIDILKIISGGSAKGGLEESELEPLLLRIAKKHSSIFRDIAEKVGVEVFRKMSPEAGVHLRSLLRLSMASFRSMRTIFTNMGYKFLPSEQKMRQVQRMMEGFMDEDHSEVVTENIVLSKKKETKRIGEVPVLRCTDLEGYIRHTYAEKKAELAEEVGWDAVDDHLPDTLDISFSADSGGLYTKYHFNWNNLFCSGSPFAVFIFAMHQGADCAENVAKVFDYYANVLKKIQGGDFRIDGRKVELLLGGDMKFQDAVLGKSNSNATYPCARDYVTVSHLKNHPKEPHTPENCGKLFEERNVESYFGNLQDNLVDDRKGDLGQKGKHHGSVVRRMCFPLVDLLRLIPPILHIMLGIVLKLFNMVENRAISFDNKKTRKNLAIKKARKQRLSPLYEEQQLARTKLKQQGCDLIDYLNLRERIISVQAGEGDEVDAIAVHQTVEKKSEKPNKKCGSLLCLISKYDDEIGWIWCSSCAVWVHYLCEVFATDEDMAAVSLRDDYVCLQCSGKEASQLVSIADAKIECLKSTQEQTDKDLQDLNDRIWKLENEIEKDMGPLQSRLIEILSEIGVDRQAYHGNSFVGNHCKKILGNYELVCSVLKQDPGLHRKFVEIFKVFADVRPLLFAKRILTQAEIEYATGLCLRFGEIFPVYFPEETLTRKMHVLVFHVPKFLAYKKSLGMFSEEEGESLHNLINQEMRPLACVRDRKKRITLIAQRFAIRQRADRKLLVPKRRICPQCRSHPGVTVFYKDGVCPECGNEQVP